MVWYGMVWNGMEWYGMVGHGIVYRVWAFTVYYHRDRPSFHFVHLYDTDLAAMLTRLTDNKALDTTFFFLMGDHGFGMGSPFLRTAHRVMLIFANHGNKRD